MSDQPQVSQPTVAVTPVAPAVVPFVPPAMPAVRRPVVNGDQEARLCERVRSAIRMAIGMRNAQKNSSDNLLLECAMDGIVNASVVDIIRTLGMEPSYTEVYRPASLETPAVQPVRAQ